MIFNSLTLENFRVFQSTHTIDLTVQNGRPIVLFGGLNGAGKTSILNAIRVLLFGRNAFKNIRTKKQYEELLVDFINGKKQNKLKHASVKLSLTFSKLGKEETYEIKRYWTFINSKLEEKLTIKNSNKEFSELDNVGAQSFINDLIPLGIADLFFFDGEKIKHMADDQDGTVLIDALKKLVGIDLIDRVVHDTGVLIRNHAKSNISKAQQDEFESKEKRLDEIENLVELKQTELDNTCYVPKIAYEDQLRRVEQKLDTAGGTWAKSRSALVSDQSKLQSEANKLKQQIVELARGSFIFMLAPNYIGELISQLEKDLDIQNQLNFNNELSNKLKKLSSDEEKSLSPILPSLLNNINEDPQHQISSYQLFGIKSTIEDSRSSNSLITEKISELNQVNKELDNLGLNIAKAPDESHLKSIFEELNAVKLEIEKINLLESSIKAEMTELLNEGISLTIELERLYVSISSEKKSTQLIDTSNQVINAMTDLSNSLLNEKLSQLEAEFDKVFKRILRKKDVIYKVRINRDSYQIELFDEQGDFVNKKAISSGEKQVFALAMIEALGKTSGKDLPFIIDTPLGRLDSKHRKNIVNDFFPVIGKQIVILSTDTEVDKNYQESIQDYLSHQYVINYDEQSQTSSLTEGYFWHEKEVSNA